MKSRIKLGVPACIMIVMLFAGSSVLKSQEFLLHEETFTWNKVNDDCGGYHYWTGLGNAPSTNWTTPYDYENGQFYFRFEIISQPSNEPFNLTMCVWTELVSTPPYYKEECIGYSQNIAGTGTIVTYNSPVTYVNNAIDWTDMSKLWHFGYVLFIDGINVSPTISCSDAAGVAKWNEKIDYYLPLTMRSTVVAVANGYTFSGWGNYPGGAPPTPAFTINYSTEKTNQNIPTTDEYSYSSSMSPSYNGVGSPLGLTPGTDVYFRVKAQGSTPASGIQHLVVAARPATPTITVDYATIQTMENIGSTIEYSSSSDFSNPLSGTGNKVSLTPGQDLYFWVKATSSSFYSLVNHLVVPARPAAPSVTIDYANERTNEVLSSSIEYSTNVSMTSPTTCANARVNLDPGTDLYFRVKTTGSSFASLVTTLDVPNRPAAPTITLNYSTEVTSVVPSTVEWSENASLSPATQGTGATIGITPGTDLYFRVKATASSFKSVNQHLTIPDRPSAPAITINFGSEYTSTIPVTVEWSENASMSPATQGTDASIAVTPGTDLYFRVKATGSSFKSDIQYLDIPVRPSTPIYSINYTDEVSNEPISASDDYSTDSGMSGATAGEDSAIAVVPGIDLYFKTRVTDTSFCSEIQHLVVVDRPPIPEFSIDYVAVTTVETVDATIEYSTVPDLSGATSGNGTQLVLDAGQDLYFRVQAGVSSFRSEIFHLMVPQRNLLNYSGEDTIRVNSFEVSAILINNTLEFKLEYLQITNGSAGNLRDENLFDVYPQEEGLITVMIPANTVIDSSFASNEVSVYYKKPVYIPVLCAEEGLNIYPNPSKDGLIFIRTTAKTPYTVDVYSGEGRMLKNITITGSEVQQIVLSDLEKGIYLLKICTDNHIYIRKLILR
jgi:hypothetical protein